MPAGHERRSRMNLTQVQVFLTLADELHFGRTAERVGLSQPRISRLVAALEREVGIGAPAQALRRGDIDVLVNWLAVDEPDLSAGPAIDHQPRVLAVASSHPLA